MKQKQYKNVCAFCALLLFSFFIVWSSAAADQEKGQGPFLWTTQIGESTVYLAASVHGGRLDDYPLDSRYLEALEKAQNVILEVAEDRAALKGIMLEFIEDYRVSENQNLLKRLSPSSKRIYTEILGEKDASFFSKYQPWLARMQVSSRMMTLVGFEPQRAVDFYIRSLAVKKEKTVLGLEEAVNQFRLFVLKLPYEKQLEILEQVLHSVKYGAEAQAKLFSAYFSNNRQGFEKQFLAMYDFSDPASRAGYDKIFASRNRGMVEKLEKIALEHPGVHMVVVGGGHLFGPDNIRELLEKKGYMVKVY
jgi:uncharacterized protein YbaP (TraB family)